MQASMLLPLELWDCMISLVVENANAQCQDAHALLQALALTSKELRALCLRHVKTARFKPTSTTSVEDLLCFFAFLQTSCPCLEELVLRGCPFIGSPVLPLSCLPSLPSLTSLDLSHVEAWGRCHPTKEAPPDELGAADNGPQVSHLRDLRGLAFWPSLRALNLEGNSHFPAEEDGAEEAEADPSCHSTILGKRKASASGDEEEDLVSCTTPRREDSQAEDFPPRLAKLNLSYTSATDQTLARVCAATSSSSPSAASSSLRQLYLSGCQRLTAPGTVAALEKMDQLHTLFLSFTSLIDETTEAAVVGSLPESLKVLSLNNTQIGSALQGLPRGLEALYLGHCRRVRSPHLANLPPALKILQLDHLYLHNHSFSRLPPTLRELSMLQMPFLTELTLRYLPRGLETLHVGQPLNDRTVGLLPQSLRRLYAVRSPITDAGLSALPTSLCYISFMNCPRVTQEGLNALSLRLGVPCRMQSVVD